MTKHTNLEVILAGTGFHSNSLPLLIATTAQPVSQTNFVFSQCPPPPPPPKKTRDQWIFCECEIEKPSMLGQRAWSCAEEVNQLRCLLSSINMLPGQRLKWESDCVAAYSKAGIPWQNWPEKPTRQEQVKLPMLLVHCELGGQKLVEPTSIADMSSSHSLTSFTAGETQQQSARPIWLNEQERRKKDQLDSFGWTSRRDTRKINLTAFA